VHADPTVAADGVSPVLRPAPTAHAVLDVIAGRWSPRAFDPDRPVPRSTLAVLLEAASWAPSSGNAQPWRYLVFDHAVPGAREQARDCLTRGNAWARRAPTLLITLAARNWPDSDEVNRHALHDVGAASYALAVQAVVEGLAVHQMAGFDAGLARARFAIPDDMEPMTFIAVGHPGPVASLDDRRRRKEGAPRVRRPVHETAFIGGCDGPGLIAAAGDQSPD
jgi:nitroreductase